MWAVCPPITSGWASPPCRKPSNRSAGEHTVSRLAPGETAQVTVTIRPTRRGCYRIGHPVCRSAFPFNLLWFGVSREGEESLIALPAFSRLQMPLRRLSRYAQTAGMRLAGRTGVSPEYIGSRPFMRGDSPRHIDARAWARLAVPATKEYDEDCDNYAALVLDTCIPDTAARDKSGQIDELEAAVSLCASVAFTMNSSHFIDLLLAGPELHEFTGWPREARLDRIHELLAGVEPSQAPPDERAVMFMLDRFREMSQVVFILLGWTQTNQQLVELARTRRLSLHGRPDRRLEGRASERRSGSHVGRDSPSPLAPGDPIRTDEAIMRRILMQRVSIRVAAARPKALPMADGQTIGKLRLPLPPEDT